MFLLDRMVSWRVSPAWFVAEAVVDPACPLFDEERRGLPSWVAFEYMAQGIAALSGIQRLCEGSGSPKIGFVIGLRDFKTEVSFFPQGARVRIEAEELMRDGPVVSFSCLAECLGQRTRAILNAIETELDP